MDLEILRHSCSHIMASAVKKLYPQAKLGIGPSIEGGFYYDFDIPGGIKEEDLKKIEKLMGEEVRKDYPFIREDWDIGKAKDFFDKQGERYKVELIEDLESAGEKKVSLYKHNEFIDLCRGPHLGSAGEVKHFKILSTSGAYWKGNEENAQMVRIYGTTFFTKDDLDNHLKNLEEAKKRDHRVLGRQLGLFDIYYNEAGAGLVFYLPAGAVLRRIIEDWEVGEHIRRGYQEVITPHIMDRKLWQQSGHLDYYQEYMYPIDKETQQFVLKPMNCPGHILIYKSDVRSWRDLPMRMFELGTVYRFEKSGVLHGLLRVRGFTQDDAHIFCKKDDLPSEIGGVLNFVKEAMDVFGFKSFNAELSTRPHEFIGDKQDWDLAESALEGVLKNKGIPYKINPGDGAFYGPKIDIRLRDALGRPWQCATVQLDYSIPKRFNLTYRAKSGQDVRVIMIHRVILGSLERFMATLIEHYAGKFPVWLAPIQVCVINITGEVKDYALEVKERLDKEQLRVEIDLKDETLQKRIRAKELLKIPYIVILGKKEKDAGNISVRMRGRKNLGNTTVEEFVKKVKDEINRRCP